MFECVLSLSIACKRYPRIETPLVFRSQEPIRALLTIFPHNKVNSATVKIDAIAGISNHMGKRFQQMSEPPETDILVFDKVHLMLRDRYHSFILCESVFYSNDQ